MVGVVTVMLPAGALLGATKLRLVSMKVKLLGEFAQINGVLAFVLLTRVRFKLKSVPAPESGVSPSLEKAETRRVRIGPTPGRTLPATVQLVAVNPPAATGGAWKVTTVSSKVKSPWNPIKFKLGLMVELVTGRTKVVVLVSMVEIGRETVIGVAVGPGVGEAVGAGEGVAVGAGVGVAVGTGVGVGVGASGVGILMPI